MSPHARAMSEDAAAACRATSPGACALWGRANVRRDFEHVSNTRRTRGSNEDATDTTDARSEKFFFLRHSGLASFRESANRFRRGRARKEGKYESGSPFALCTIQGRLLASRLELRRSSRLARFGGARAIVVRERRRLCRPLNAHVGCARRARGGTSADERRAFPPRGGAFRFVIHAERFGSRPTRARSPPRRRQIECVTPQTPQNNVAFGSSYSPRFGSQIWYPPPAFLARPLTRDIATAPSTRPMKPKMKPRAPTAAAPSICVFGSSYHALGCRLT